MCFEAAATMGAPSSVISLERTFSFIESGSEPQFLISSHELNRNSNSSNYNCKVEEEEEEEEGRWELVDYHSLPEFLKHNEYILSYYRSEWPLKQTFLSLFSLHNETLNIWTHVIGFFIFLILTCYAASVFPVDRTTNSTSPQVTAGNSSNTFILISPTAANINTPALQISRWPFYLYLAGAMFCLLMSSACHLLSCHSARTCYLMLRLDYAGITALIVSSFYPLVYYSFACNPFFRDVYLASITLFGAAAIVASLAPVFETPQFLPARAVLFACMAASGIVPIAHKMAVFGHRPEAVVTTGYEAVMGMFYGLGVLVYAARVPERWLPGKFDLAGHSHQLFHVLVIAGAYTHYLASLVYLTWREAEGC